MDFRRATFLTAIFLTMHFFAGKMYAQEIESNANKFSAEEISVQEIEKKSAENFWEEISSEPSAGEISDSENEIEKVEAASASESEENTSPANFEETEFKINNFESENEISETENLEDESNEFGISENENSENEIFEKEENFAKENSAETGKEEFDAKDESAEAAPPVELKKNYYIEKDSRQRTKFVQRLSWQEIPNVENYEIEIQKFVGDENLDFFAKDYDGNYKTILNETVPHNFIEVSLEAGDYRFQVSAANLLDREKKSEWKNFTVLKAIMPKIASVRPKKVNVNSEKGNDGIFSLHGENFFDGTSFALLAVEIDGAEKEISQGKILEVSPDGKTARVQFDSEKIIEGNYKISAKNPGDFSDVSENISAKPKFLSFDTVQLGAGYFLPILFYDGTLEKYMDTNIMFLNASADISLIFSIRKKTHFGAGLKAHYSRIQADTALYDFSGNYLTGMFNLIYQAHFIPKKLVLELHAGVGVATLFDAKFDYSSVQFSSPNLDAMGLAFGGGFALQYLPGKSGHFFLAAGADFVHVKFKDMSCGTISPQISLGVKF